MLGSFNNWNIVQITNKNTPSEEFDALHKIVVNGISENMSSLVHVGKYGAINASDTTTMGYYVIKYLYETYTLQKFQTTDGQVSKSVEILVKAEYLSFMKSKRTWYW